MVMDMRTEEWENYRHRDIWRGVVWKSYTS